MVQPSQPLTTRVILVIGVADGLAAVPTAALLAGGVDDVLGALVAVRICAAWLLVARIALPQAMTAIRMVMERARMQFIRSGIGLQVVRIRR